MAFYLEMFERNARASGARCIGRATPTTPARSSSTICKAAGAKVVTRSKSMLGEEIGLPHALAEAGLRRVETDLAEHIIQLAGETPSHIIWPAAHRTREDVAKLFDQYHHEKPAGHDVDSMVASARKELRADFFAAEVGISGANFLVAETGAICTITNEGNAELTTTPPRVHIVTAGIEKIVASTEHALQLTRLLVRSATGADLTQYTTFHCGPKRARRPRRAGRVPHRAGRSRPHANAGAKCRRCCAACAAAPASTIAWSIAPSAATPMAAPIPARWARSSPPCSTDWKQSARPARRLHPQRPVPTGLPGGYSPADPAARIGAPQF